MFEGEIRSEYVTTTSIDRDGKREPRTRLLAEHEVVDHRLCTYAKQRAALDAAESYDLVRAQKYKLHVYYGFAPSWSIWSAAATMTRTPRGNGCAWRSRSSACPTSWMRGRRAT